MFVQQEKFQHGCSRRNIHQSLTDSSNEPVAKMLSLTCVTAQMGSSCACSTRKPRANSGMKKSQKKNQHMRLLPAALKMARSNCAHANGLNGCRGKRKKERRSGRCHEQQMTLGRALLFLGLFSLVFNFLQRKGVVKTWHGPPQRRRGCDPAYTWTGGGRAAPRLRDVLPMWDDSKRVMLAKQLS